MAVADAAQSAAIVVTIVAARLNWGVYAQQSAAACRLQRRSTARMQTKKEQSRGLLLPCQCVRKLGIVLAHFICVDETQTCKEIIAFYGTQIIKGIFFK